ncbi:translocon-associated protein subunit delta-like [Amphibalanus amphitrite]|uniref:translocon-associated protein subunit delta-like n=1 Tax=Amphibalanus amphitrite TaxID=1232801 RepID=UPI001C9130E4|nr:translocon-associated protein subunit delta-like [Amphibalanus amphitrite]
MNMVNILLIFGLIGASLASDACQHPQIKAESYTSQDATIVTNIAYIATFSLTCANGVTGVSLYAAIGDRLVPVARSADGATYQVSWTEEVAKATTGDHAIGLYDDVGYAAVRKAQRSDEPISSVKPMATIIVNHPGAYTGPLVNSEFMAALLASVVFYVAFSTRSTLQA